MNHAITGDGTILEPSPTDQPIAILTADRDIPEGLRVVLAHDIPVPDDTELPPPTALALQLIATLADLVRTNERLGQDLATAHRALAIEVANRLRGQPEPGDVVDRAERYGNDLDAVAAIARLRARIDQLLTGPARYISIAEVNRLLAGHDNAAAPAGSFDRASDVRLG